MIKATELRLGNRLWWNPSANEKTTVPPTVVEVASIEAESIGYFSPSIEHRVEPFEDDLLQTQTPHRPLKEFSAIPLTKEVVAKCAFDKSNGGWQLVSLVEQASGYDVLVGKEKLGNVEYLHQLQNIHFILTGEELEIEP